MATKAASKTKPIMTDAGIKRKTGKDWDGGSRRSTRRVRPSWTTRASPRSCGKNWKAGRWWGQMIAVSYERARGIRAMNQKCDGEFSVSCHKSHARRRWRSCMPLAPTRSSGRNGFPRARLRKPRAPRTNISAAKWKKDARIAVDFYAKGADKAQIAFDIGKLSDNAAVESERAAWKKAVEKLEKLLE